MHTYYVHVPIVSDLADIFERILWKKVANSTCSSVPVKETLSECNLQKLVNEAHSLENHGSIDVEYKKVETPTTF